MGNVSGEGDVEYTDDKTKILNYKEALDVRFFHSPKPNSECFYGSECIIYVLSTNRYVNRA